MMELATYRFVERKLLQALNDTALHKETVGILLHESLEVIMQRMERLQEPELGILQEQGHSEDNIEGRA